MAPSDDETFKRLAQIQADIASLRDLLETRLSSLAEELRRAEARDEWTAVQMREARGHLRKQDALLEEIRDTLFKNSSGLY